MRLIDADELRESVVKEMLKAELNSPIYCTLECVIADIEGAATAYDMDKVVEQLGKYSERMEKAVNGECFEEGNCQYDECAVCAFQKAIEIVKTGYVN